MYLYNYNYIHIKVARSKVRSHRIAPRSCRIGSHQGTFASDRTKVRSHRIAPRFVRIGSHQGSFASDRTKVGLQAWWQWWWQWWWQRWRRWWRWWWWWCCPPTHTHVFLSGRTCDRLWSWCLTSFDDDMQSLADQRPIKYKTPGLQGSVTSPRTHCCRG